MANNFFKNGDKAYSENLNDSVLVGNAFDWTLEVALPSDTGSVFPNSNTVVKAKVCDVSISPNSNLSIGSTISNSSGSSQVYRLTVYPNFNRFGGFKSITLTADSGVTFYIANKGGTSPIANNLDYTNLSNVPELKVLKEYDIVLTIPTGKSVSGLSFVLQSSSADVTGSISQSNVTGLETSLDSKVNVSDIVDNLTTNNSSKVLSAKQGKVLNDGKVNDSQKIIATSSSPKDLNDYTVTGFYYCQYNEAGFVSNKPSEYSDGFILLVEYGGLAYDTNHKMIKQTITVFENSMTSNKGETFIRLCYAGEWQSWKKVKFE